LHQLPRPPRAAPRAPTNGCLSFLLPTETEGLCICVRARSIYTAPIYNQEEGGEGSRDDDRRERRHQVAGIQYV
jgi:hypothetical protein